jgi:hypothetical protein
MHIIIASITTLLIALGYSLIVHICQPEKFWDWLNTLVGSGLSFFLAVLGGIYLFKLQGRATEENDLKTLKELLCSEFSDLLRILGDSSKMELTLQSGTVKQVLIAYTQPLVIEKSALSGLFNRQESENLLHLARKLRMLNFKSEHLMAVIQSRAEEQFVAHAINNVEETRIASIQGIRHMSLQLNIPINENYPD